MGSTSKARKPCSATLCSFVHIDRDPDKGPADRSAQMATNRVYKGARAFALPSLGAAAQFIAPEYNLSGVTLLRPLDATRVSAISLPFQEITPPGLVS